MRLPAAWYPLREELATFFDQLRPAQLDNLVLFAGATVVANSGCESAIITAVQQQTPEGERIPASNTLRARLREFLHDAADKAAPCQTEVSVAACVGALVRWILAQLQGSELALAFDATDDQDELTALVVSIVYRSQAVPVAWHIRRGGEAGSWTPIWQRLLAQVHAAVPAAYRVVVMADEGLWSPTLFAQLQQLGWAPLLRLHATTQVLTGRGAQQRWAEARSLVAAPDHCWLGRATIFKTKPAQRRATLVVVWLAGYEAPWVLISSLPPRAISPLWYRMRAWIECGFRDLKRLGWQWQRCQRRKPARVERQWLLLAVATVWVLGYGTRRQEQERQGLPMGAEPPLPATPLPPPETPPTRSVFTIGRSECAHRLISGRLWLRRVLLPWSWPLPPPHVRLLWGEDDDP